ncbi:MAG: TolC family protein [Bacteroidota bacterium]
MLPNSLKKSILFLFVSLAGLMFVRAQESTPTFLVIQSLEDAWDYAHKHNPNLQQYQLQQRKAEADYKAAQAYKLPQISGSFSLQNNTSLATTPLPGEIFGQPGETVDAQFGQQYTYNAGITISKNLLDQKSRLQAKMTQQNSLYLSQQTVVFEQALKEQVALYYYTALVAEKALRISQQDLRLADSIATISKQKREEGLIDQLALNQSLINRNNISQNIIQYESLLDQCQQELRKLWGTSFSTDLKFTEEVKNTLPVLGLSMDMQTDASVKLSEIELEQADIQVNMEKAAYLPTLTINSYWGKQQFRDDFGLSFSNSAWNDYSYISFGLQVPIFNGFATKNKVKAAKIERDIAYQEWVDTRRTSEIEDTFLLEEYQRSWSLLTTSYENYQLFETNSVLTFQKYEEGLLSLDASLKAFEDYLQSENSYLNNLSTLYSHYASIISRNP